MLGLIQPSKGSIFLNDLCPTNAKSRINVGVVPQISQFINELTIRETIKLIGKHYSRSMPLIELMQHFTLDEIIDKQIEFLSEGEKRRLALALAFVGNPKIVFLDEPTVGVDVQSRLKLWEFIKTYRKPDTIIFLTTHYLEEAQALSDRILILHAGKIVKDGSVDHICKSFPFSKISFKLHQASYWISNFDITVDDNQIHHIQTYDADSFIREMVINEVAFYELQICKSNLEDVFIKLLQE
jgi:ABC-2 type transport system ATP-binding protein